MIPVCIPFIGDKELEYVVDCIKTNKISSKGKYVEDAEYKGRKTGGIGYIGCFNFYGNKIII